MSISMTCIAIYHDTYYRSLYNVVGLLVSLPRSICGAGSMKQYGVRPSVRLSVTLSNSPAAAACSEFAAVGPVARDIDCLLQQRRAVGECGQCHVVSVRM